MRLMEKAATFGVVAGTGRASLSADPALRFAPFWLIVVVATVAMGLTWLVMKGLRV